MSPSTRAPAEEEAQSCAGKAATPKSQHLGVDKEIRGSLFPSTVGFVGDAELQRQPCPPRDVAVVFSWESPRGDLQFMAGDECRHCSKRNAEKVISVRMRRDWDHLALTVL